MLNKQKLNLKDLLGALGVFSLVSTPSIKIFIYSDMVNAVSLLILLCSAALAKPNSLRLTRARLSLLASWLLYILLILVFYLNGSYFDSNSLHKLIYLFVSVLVVVLVGNYSVLNLSGWLLFAWGFFIAIFQMLVGFDLSKELGQHYLTISTPIGLSICFAVRALFDVGDRGRVRWLTFFSIPVMVLALLTTHSRSGILFPSAIFMVMFVLYFSFASNVKRSSSLSILLSLAFLAVVFYLLSSDIKFVQYERLERLFNSLSSEPRMADYYLKALDYISKRPWMGYGTNSSYELYGNYPHNIFLEILTYGGILLLLPFLTVVIIYCGATVRAIRKFHRVPGIFAYLAATIFLFLMWNVSWGIYSSYIFLVPMCLFIVVVSDLRNMERRLVGENFVGGFGEESNLKPTIE